MALPRKQNGQGMGLWLCCFGSVGMKGAEAELPPLYHDQQQSSASAHHHHY